ncbi:serine/threonine-protein phosphatase 4 regulatory subunit 3A isoform X4 [Folsomia candida]|uniref:serine/threonine-protein phosphatase 4 regulatory subunit 3A isoform X4 n=1 Tax=Folsomia candida TaxID=158441 RepID=UPI000B901E76|nr:serine/threonine-protein phosphatase 4 regulatory subunit 3A isoform X4 [Folsomia candida]
MTDTTLSSSVTVSDTVVTDNTRRRVKLYALNAERQWDDRGTGHVSSSYVDRLKGMSLLVRAESDGSLLLESKIQPDTAYQKQQDTLIVWSEGDNFDLALSFQEKAGCDEIWEKICQVQGKDPSVDITQDVVEESEDERFEDVSDPAPPIELPTPDISRLEELHDLIISCLAVPLRREKLSLALEQEGFLKKVLESFRLAEQNNDTNALQQLYHIFRNIFLLNKNAIFEILFAEELIFDVVGCLEYEPNHPCPKKHREYLKRIANFRQVISIGNAELVSKIHQTYRVQYIHDAVLPAPNAFEENMLSTLSSFIFFNKVEIVTLIQEDEKVLKDLFTGLTDESTPDDKRRDLILFLKELCAFAQNLQPQARESFYKTLTNQGVLPALELALPLHNSAAKAACIDVLNAVVEFSPTIVREYCLHQAADADDDQLLLNVIIEELINDKDPELGGAVQLSGVLRLLIDPENMMAALNKSEKADFLNLFYKQSMNLLIEPLMTNTIGEKPDKEDIQNAQLMWLLLELLSFCVEHHSYHIKSYIINKDLVRKVLVLMSSKHTFLVLGALRLLRKVLSLKDDLYNRYIIKGNLFKPVIDALIRNKGRYNLLDSAIVEMFEFIRAVMEDIKLLVSHIVENYSQLLDQINYVQTFRALKLRYEQNQDRSKERVGGIDSVPALLRNNRYRRDPRQLEEEEEMWFNDDDDMEDGDGVVPASNSPEVLGRTKADADSQLESIGKLLDKKVDSLGSGMRNIGNSLSPRSSPITVSSPNSTSPNAMPLSTSLTSTSSDTKPGLAKKSVFQQIFATLQESVTQIGLVDYEGDSDEEETEEHDESPTPAEEDHEKLEPVAKRPRLT